MKSELHIVNGKSTLGLLERAELDGAFVSGDDLLAHGAWAWDRTMSRLEFHASLPR